MPTIERVRVVRNLRTTRVLGVAFSRDGRDGREGRPKAIASLDVEIAAAKKAQRGVAACINAADAVADAP